MPMVWPAKDSLGLDCSAWWVTTDLQLAAHQDTQMTGLLPAVDVRLGNIALVHRALKTRQEASVVSPAPGCTC